MYIIHYYINMVEVYTIPDQRNKYKYTDCAKAKKTYYLVFSLIFEMYKEHWDKIQSAAV